MKVVHLTGVRNHGNGEGFRHGRYLIGETPDNRSEHLVRHFHQLCHRAIRPDAA